MGHKKKGGSYSVKNKAVANKQKKYTASKFLTDKRIIYTAAFGLPFLCMLVIYALMDVFPFGDKTALVMDLNAQYADFFAYFHRVLLGDESLLYSFTKEMGGNVFGLFTYYLSSPFFLLAAFFPQSAMPEGIALITALKIGACGLTFTVFIKNAFEKCDVSTLIFSCAYALMTYSIHYSMCVMWLDAAIWLPLIILGTERVLKGGKPWLFMVAFALTLFSNYYTAYMSALFTVIYYIFRYFSGDDKKSLRDFLIKTLKMIAAGLCCVLMAGVILIPSLMDMLSGKLSSASYVADGFWNIDIFDIPKRLFIGQYDSITNRGNPNIFCGVICGVMTGVFFVQPKIKLRLKLGALIVYAILISSFFIKELDMAWHIFKYPNWFPYRYAYVFCFFSITLAFYGFSRARSGSKAVFFGGAGIYAALLLGVWSFYDSVLTNERLAALTLIFAAVYIVGLALTFFGAKRFRPYICSLLVVLTCVELVVNGYATLKGLDREHGFKSKTEYNQYVEVIGEAVDYIEEYDDGFYRMEKTFSRTDNDSMKFGYNGMTHYSSTYNRNIVDFNSDMGMLQEYICMRYLGSTLLTDSILGVKYVVSEEKVNDEYIELRRTGSGLGIYENPYALSIGFAADESALNQISYGSSWLENQDKFAQSALGESFVSRVSSAVRVDGGAGREFTAPSDGTYYLELDPKYEGNIELTVNGRSVNYEYDRSEKKIFCIGSYSRGDRVRVALDSSEDMSKAVISGVDSARFERACREKQESGSLNITDYGNTWIEGEITLEDEQILFTTIPYEDGWKVYIDGERVETENAQETFLAVRAEAGEHTVKLKYSAPGFGAGLAVSLIAVAGVLIFAFRKEALGLIVRFRAEIIGKKK